MSASMAVRKDLSISVAEELAATEKIVHNRALICSLIAQSVERRTVNPQVPGSSPGRGAKKYKSLAVMRGFFNFVDSAMQ